MIWFHPVKAFARNDQYLFLMQEIKCKLFIICNIELLGIDLREDIESSMRFYYRNSRDIFQCIIDALSLLINSSTRFDILCDTLVSTKCSLYNGLGRNIRRSR